MYGFMYGASGGDIPVSGAGKVFLRMEGHADVITVIHSVFISQDTEMGDADAEMWLLDIYRYDTINVSGTPETEYGLMPGAPTARCAISTGNSQSTGQERIHRESWNLQAGFAYVPVPSARIIIPAVAAEGIEFGTPNGPIDPVDLQMSVVWEEIPV